MNGGCAAMLNPFVNSDLQLIEAVESRYLIGRHCSFKPKVIEFG